MTVHSGSDLCRVRVVAPDSQVDLALPTTVPLADLLPSMLRLAGADADGGGGGWALQRLGEAPLDTGADIAELGLRDGEVLHLRPHAAVLPAVDYDDVVDAVGATLRPRADRWRPAAARAVSLAVAATLAAAGAVLLARSGPPWAGAWLTSLVAAVAVLGVAGALPRAAGDVVAGTVLACSGAPYAFLAGLVAFADDRRLSALGPQQFLLAAALTVLYAAVALLWVGDGSPALLAVLVLGLAGVLAAGMAASSAGVPGGAAAVAVVVVACGPLISSLSYRLARLPLPFVPARAEELREDPDALPTAVLLDRVTRADRLVTGLTVGSALALGVAIAVLAPAPGWAPPSLGLVASLVALLRARLFTGLHQRLWLLIAGLAGIALVALRLGAQAGGDAPAVVVGLLAAAGIGLGVALRPPGRAYRPYWPRVGDVCELLVVASVIPIALEVLGLYGYIRALWG
jgi:type VII secretion integral membrane protein EccD